LIITEKRFVRRFAPTTTPRSSLWKGWWIHPKRLRGATAERRSGTIPREASQLTIPIRKEGTRNVIQTRNSLHHEQRAYTGIIPHPALREPDGDEHKRREQECQTEH
jgi:hypothetical protein